MSSSNCTCSITPLGKKELSRPNKDKKQGKIKSPHFLVRPPLFSLVITFFSTTIIIIFSYRKKRFFTHIQSWVFTIFWWMFVFSWFDNEYQLTQLRRDSIHCRQIFHAQSFQMCTVGNRKTGTSKSDRISNGEGHRNPTHAGVHDERYRTQQTSPSYMREGTQMPSVLQRTLSVTASSTSIVTNAAQPSLPLLPKPGRLNQG